MHDFENVLSCQLDNRRRPRTTPQAAQEAKDAAAASLSPSAAAAAAAAGAAGSASSRRNKALLAVNRDAVKEAEAAVNYALGCGRCRNSMTGGCNNCRAKLAQRLVSALGFRALCRRQVVCCWCCCLCCCPPYFCPAH